MKKTPGGKWFIKDYNAMKCMQIVIEINKVKRLGKPRKYSAGALDKYYGQTTHCPHNRKEH